MKYLKIFEEYRIKSKIYGSEYIYPDFFKDSLLSKYYNLLHGDDKDYFVEKKMRKDAKKLGKEIVGYINDYKKLDNSLIPKGIEYPIIDFELIFGSDPDNWRNHKLIGFKITTIMGSYQVSQECFEDICRYTSDPELYLNTKKYNL